MKIIASLIVFGAVVAISIVALRLLYRLPDNDNRPESLAIPASQATKLGTWTIAASELHPGQSGVLPLSDGREAFAARVLLSRAAEESIDARYYIWQSDVTGWILLDELRAAAERGVRVRLLLDDNGIPGLDAELAALHALPTAEVRLFNPFVLRKPKLLNYLFDFGRLNRRMHNKSMTVDGAVTVIGGRNIGDIYFGYGEQARYFDFDVLAAGQAASDVATDFDRYWSSASAYPADTMLPRSDTGLQSVMDMAAKARASLVGSSYADAIETSSLITKLNAGSLSLEWTNVTLVSDDPAKGLGIAPKGSLLVERLPGLLDRPEESVDLVSAYFVPGDRGTDLLTGLSDAGVATRVLTNSLASNDVAAVHSAYMGYRKDLLEGGVTLLELRERPAIDEKPAIEQYLGSSTASLHAKAFAVDRQRVFIGSFNFDPRSAALNTEMGFLVESPSIAKAMSQSFNNDASTYRVGLSETRGLIWSTVDAAGQKISFDIEPNTSRFQRVVVRILSWLPVQWML